MKRVKVHLIFEGRLTYTCMRKYLSTRLYRAMLHFGVHSTFPFKTLPRERKRESLKRMLMFMTLFLCIPRSKRQKERETHTVFDVKLIDFLACSCKVVVTDVVYTKRSVQAREHTVYIQETTCKINKTSV